MKKIMLFPFDLDSSTIINYFDCIPDGILSAVVSFRGWGVAGHPLSDFDGMNAGSHLYVSDDFSTSLESCDTVWFVNEHKKLYHLQKQILADLHQALEQGKQVIWSIDYQRIGLDEYSFEQQLGSCREQVTDTVKPAVLPMSDELLENTSDAITTPIVLVSGECENINKFDLQLGLKKKLTARGWKVSHIGSRSYSSVFSSHAFPLYLFQGNYTDLEQITALRKIFRYIEETEQPDLFLVGIPGGAYPLNKFIHNHYGMLLSKTVAAIDVDYTIFSLLNYNLSQEHLDDLTAMFPYRFELDIDSFHVPNRVFDDVSYSGEITKMNHLLTDEKYCLKILSGLSSTGPVTQIYDTGIFDTLYNSIYEKLS